MRDHGTVQRYVTGKCRCDSCRAANAAYMRWLRAARKAGRVTKGQGVDATGTIRRVHALNCLGWSTPVVFAHAGFGTRGRDTLKRGRVTARIAFGIRATYEDLWDKKPPEVTRGEKVSAVRTRERARRAGWADPLAWAGADIDDPAAVPDMGGIPDEPGWVVVELAHLHGLGESPVIAVAQIGTTLVAAERLARRHGRKDLARWIDTAA